MVTIKRIVVGTDMSDFAHRAETRAAMLARELHCESLDLLHIIDSLGLESLRELTHPLVDTEQRLMELSRKQLAEVERRLSENYGIRVTTTTLNVGRIHADIVRYAKLVNAGVVVLGAHGGGFVRDLFVGSTIDKVLGTLACPLLIVKREPETPYRRVLVPVDFSESSRLALQVALSIAPGAEIDVLHAFEVPLEAKLQLDNGKMQTYRAEMSEQKREEMQEFVSGSGTRSSSLSQSVKPGPAASVIRKKAEALQADLIVIGRHGKAGWEDMLLGSVMKQVLHDAVCDVLVAGQVTAPQ